MAPHATYLNGLFRIALLHDAHGGIGNEDEQDDEGLDKGRKFPIPLLEKRQYEGDHGRQQEDLHQLVFELLQNQLPQGRPLLAGQLYRRGESEDMFWAARRSGRRRRRTRWKLSITIRSVFCASLQHLIVRETLAGIHLERLEHLLDA